MTKEYKFSAKRLDNFELIEGYYSINTYGNPVIALFDESGNSRAFHGIDPSTITPLFTTDKPDEWIFENVDKLFLTDLTLDDRSTVTDTFFSSDNLEVYKFRSGESIWISNGAYLESDGIYRVKSPGYSIDDAANDVMDLMLGDENYEKKLRVILSRVTGGNDE